MKKQFYTFFSLVTSKPSKPAEASKAREAHGIPMSTSPLFWVGELSQDRFSRV